MISQTRTMRPTETQRLVPANIEAEQALLGAVLLDNDALLMVKTTPGEFYLEKHADIWYAMQSLQAEGKPIDMITLTAKLENAGKLAELGGAAYLTGLYNATPSAAGAATYADAIERAAFCRQLVGIAGEIAGIAYDSKDAAKDEMMARAHRALMAVDAPDARQDGLSLYDAISEFIPELTEYLSGKREAWGVPTGLKDLDAYIGGLAFGEMSLIAADPAQGKTMLATTIAVNAAMRGYAGAFFSLEMKRRQLMLRFFAERGNVDTANIRRGTLCETAKAKMFDEVEKVQDLPLYIYDEPKDTAGILRDILRLQRRLEAQGQELKFAMVDYSDLLQDRGETEVVRMKNISHALKNIAKRTGVALVVVHPITRDRTSQIVKDEKTGKARLKDGPPELHNLGWGRAWEYDSHTVLFPFFAADRTDYAACIKVGKYRDGIGGKAIDLYFDGKRWRDLYEHAA